MNADQTVAFRYLEEQTGILPPISTVSKARMACSPLPEIHRLYASVAATETIAAAVDTQSLKIMATVGPINYPAWAGIRP